nr:MULTISPECIES: hypothetical protein [unclassified Bradyrhizobium]
MSYLAASGHRSQQNWSITVLIDRILVPLRLSGVSQGLNHFCGTTLGCGRGGVAAPLSGFTAAGNAMRTYFFDMKDGIPTRDRTGLTFATHAGAIEHSRNLARRLRHDPRITNRTLSVVVVDESGTEIHREPVYPMAADATVS